MASPTTAVTSLTSLVVCGVLLLTGCAGSMGGSGAAAAPMGGATAMSRLPTPDATTALDVGAVPSCPAVRRVAPRADGLAPLRLPCLGAGPAVRLSDLRGRPMVLSVWAAWCQPCAEEVPRFAALHRALGDRVRFFGVQYKAPRRFGLSAAKDFGVFFPSVQDTSGAATVRALHAAAPPQTFFVTADGRVVKHTFGAVPSEAALAAQVARYLGVRA